MRNKKIKSVFSIILSAAMVFSAFCPVSAKEYSAVSVRQCATGAVNTEVFDASDFASVDPSDLSEELLGCASSEEETNGDGAVVYATPTASENAAGTKADPINLGTALKNAKPGDEIRIPAGSYVSAVTFTASALGTDVDHIKLKGDGGKAVLDFSTHPNHASLDADNDGYDKDNGGIKLTGSYWELSDIEICHVPGVGLQVSGSNNKIENCLFHHNRDSGLQISGGGDRRADWAHDNLVLNCTSHDNYDDFRPKYGEDADGFAAKIQLGSGNVFSGCIAYCNSDDGWDLFAKDDNFPNEACTIINCIAFGNGYMSDGTTSKEGDGNGFKLGSKDWAVPNRVMNCLAFDNVGHGFTDNNNTAPIEIRKCTSYNNGKGNGFVRGQRNYGFEQEVGGQSSDLLSVYSSSAAPNGLDKFNATIDHCVLQGNDGSYHIGDTTAIVSSSMAGEKLEKVLDEHTFVSVDVPAYATTDFDKVWRNSDGNLALGGLFEVSEQSPAYSWSRVNKALGADLSQGKYQEFDEAPLTSAQFNQAKLEGKAITIPTDGKILNLSLYQVDGGKFPNPSKTPAIPATFGNEYFTVKAGTGKQMTLGDAKSEADFAYFEDGQNAGLKKRLVLNGDPELCDEGYLARCVEFTVPEKAYTTVTTYAYADEAGARLAVYKADGSLFDEGMTLQLKKKAFSGVSFTLNTPGKYYIGTKNYQKDTYIYYIQQTDTLIPDPVPEVEPTEEEKAKDAMEKGMGSAEDTAVVTPSADGKTFTLDIQTTETSLDRVLTVNKGDKITLAGYEKKSLQVDAVGKKLIGVNSKGVLKAKKATTSSGVKFSYKINGGNTTVNLTLIIKDPTVNVSGNGLAKPMKKLSAQVYEDSEFDISMDMTFTGKVLTDKAKNKAGVVFYDAAGNAVPDITGLKFILGDDKKLHVRGKTAYKGSCSIPFAAYGKKYTLKIKVVTRK